MNTKLGLQLVEVFRVVKTAYGLLNIKANLNQLHRLKRVIGCLDSLIDLGQTLLERLL